MNIKNVFASPAKKVLSLTGVLALGAGIFYGVYTNDDPVQLSGDLLNVIAPQSIKSPPVLDPSVVEVWLSAGQQVTTDAQGNVIKWGDLSGNGNDVVAEASHAPKLVQENEKGIFNFHPVLSFDGQNDFMESVAKGGYGDHIFMVFRAKNNISSSSPNLGQTVLGFNDPNLADGAEISGFNIGPSVSDFFDYFPGEVFTFAAGSYYAGLISQGYFYPQIPLVLQMRNSDTFGPQMYVNGSIDLVNGTSQQQPFSFIKDLPFFLGTNAGKNRFFNGEIAEIIILKNGVSKEEADSIQDYLGTKYGVQIGVSNNYNLNAGETTLFDVSAQPTYNKSTFGIGRYDAIGLNIGGKNTPHSFSQTSNLSQRVIGIGQASDLSNGDFVYIASNAHNNQWSNQSTSEGALLLNKKWRIKESSINVGENQAEADEGVGSVVMTLRTNQELNIPEPPANTSYAFAFFESENFTGQAKKYAYLNDKGQDGDITAGDKIYSTTVDDLEGLNYFTLVQFGPIPTSLKIDSALQDQQDGKKVKINTTVKDVNKEENIEMLVQLESDGDAQCNGPWSYATLSTPIISSQGIVTLLSKEKQNQNQGFQLENIQTTAGYENQVSFLWDAGMDLPQFFDTPNEESKHCLRFLVRDQVIEGAIETTVVKLTNGTTEQEEPKATIKVNVTGPEAIGKGAVSITNNVANKVGIAINSTENFIVPAGQNYAVMCELIEGYNVTTSPNPVVINAIPAQSEQSVACNYAAAAQEQQQAQQTEEEEEEQQQVPEEPEEAKLTLKVTGLESGAVAKVSVSGGVANNIEIANNTQKDFTVQAGAAYSVTCEEKVSDAYFLTNVDNPTVIGEGVLPKGAQAIVTCEYASGDPAEGTLEYTEELKAELKTTVFETETACLEYDSEIRDLEFTDITNLNEVGAKEAMILSRTFLLGGTPSEELKEVTAQFPLSGGGSTIGGTDRLEAQVNLSGVVTRADAIKFIMNTFCIPIFNGVSLTNQTVRMDGQAMPTYADMPREGLVAHHIIATASFLGIVEGRNYQGKFDPNLPNVIDWNAPVTKAELIKMVTNAQMLWQGYQTPPNFSLADQYGISKSQWFYAFVARALRQNSESPLLQIPNVLQNPESPATRGMMIKYVFDTLNTAGLYKDPDAVKEAWVKLNQQ